MQEVIPRPKVVEGVTIEGNCGCGKFYVTLNSYAGQLFEVFIHLGKAGGCGSANKEALGKVMSLGLRSGVNPEVFVKYLSGINCQHGEACISVVAKIIEEHLDEHSKH